MTITSGARRSAADVLAKAKARTGRVRIYLGGDLADEHEQLTAQLEAVRVGGSLADSDDRLALAERIVDLERQMDDEAVEFVFRGMGRGQWRKLLADHPPADDQKAKGAEFDIETFPFEAMAKCLVDPAMTADELRQLNDEVLDEAQFAQLWACCLSVNVGSGRPESQAARRLLEASGRHRSEQPSDSASLEAS